jgi:hypothetical protein
MFAERLILETDLMGIVHNLPLWSPNRKVEAIFLVLDEYESQSSGVTRREPHPDLAGQMRILGDIMSSAPTATWNLPA